LPSSCTSTRRSALPRPQPTAMPSGVARASPGARPPPSARGRAAWTLRSFPESVVNAPGEARATPDGIAVGCGRGSALLLVEVQLEGKRRAPASEFVKGQPVAAGTVLGR